MSALSLVAFLVAAVTLPGALLGASWLIRARARVRSPLTLDNYESGENPAALAGLRFHPRYYVVALFFVVFDIEAAFLLPWAAAVRELGTAAFVGAALFAAVLLLGWAWAIRKAALRWQ
jgi:NADH:ubiquinone oxidoreductase subunit 3 (subunit A)